MLINTFVCILMLIKLPVVHKHPHYTMNVEVFYHHGSVISVLMMLSVITIITSRNKAVEKKTELSGGGKIKEYAIQSPCKQALCYINVT